MPIHAVSRLLIHKSTKPNKPKHKQRFHSRFESLSAQLAAINQEIAQINQSKLPIMTELASLQLNTTKNQTLIQALEEQLVTSDIQINSLNSEADLLHQQINIELEILKAQQKNK